MMPPRHPSRPNLTPSTSLRHLFPPSSPASSAPPSPRSESPAFGTGATGYKKSTGAVTPREEYFPFRTVRSLQETYLHIKLDKRDDAVAILDKLKVQLREAGASIHSTEILTHSSPPSPIDTPDTGTDATEIPEGEAVIAICTIQKVDLKAFDELCKEVLTNNPSTTFLNTSQSLVIDWSTFHVHNLIYGASDSGASTPIEESGKRLGLNGVGEGVAAVAGDAGLVAGAGVGAGDGKGKVLKHV